MADSWGTSLGGDWAVPPACSRSKVPGQGSGDKVA